MPMENNPYINIMNWNARSINNKLYELTEFLNNNEIDIACICETFLDSSKNIFIPGYKIFRNDRQGQRGGGVALIVKSNVSCSLNPDLNLEVIESISMNIKTNSYNLCIVTVYMPQNCNKKNNLEKKFHNDLLKLTNINGKYMIFGDLNAKSRSWNNSQENKNGRILTDILDIGKVHILFPNSPTFLSQRKGTTSTLDIALTNISSLLEPTVYTELSSDHYPVLYKLYERSETAMVQGKLNYRTTNWRLYRTILLNNVTLDPVLNSAKDINECFSDLQRKTIFAIENSTRRSISNHTTIELDIFTKSLIRLRNIRRRQYQRLRLPALKVEVNRLNRAIAQKMAELKNINFTKMIEIIDPYSKPFWKLCKVLKSKPRPIPSLQVDGKVAVTPYEKAEEISLHFLKSHNIMSDFTSPVESKVYDKVREFSLQQFELTDDIKFYSGDIKFFIRSLKNFKAPGKDKVLNIAIKQYPSEIIELLTTLFNRCIEISYYPEIWKSWKVIPLLKPAKPPNLSSSYRPISLLSNLSKVFEKLLHERIINFMTEKNLFLENQFGFRMGHSTCHQLQRVVNTIKSNKESRHSTAIALLDIEKAFDSVWHEGLIYKMIEAKFPTYIIKIIQSYLKDRTYEVTVAGVSSDCRDVPAGVPQGAIISPTLFNFYLSDIPNVEPNCEYAFFADDTAVIVRGKQKRSVIRRLKDGVTTYFNYLIKWKIKPNYAKTNIMYIPYKFSKRLIPTEPLALTENDTVDWSKEIKYLGLTLDRKLNFARHVNITLEKCNKYRNALYSLLNRKSKLNIKNRIAIYKQILRPVISYGSSVWQICARTHKNRLAIFERKTLKMILKKNMRTRTSLVYKLCKMKDLLSWIEDLFDKLKQKSLNSPFENVNNIYS